MGKTNTHISNHTYHASQVSLVSAHATCKPCPSHIPSPWRGEIIGAMIHINNPTQQHQHQRKPTAIPPYRHLVNQHSQPKVSSTNISQQTKYLFSINHKTLFSSIHTNRTTNDFTPTPTLIKCCEKNHSPHPDAASRCRNLTNLTLTDDHHWYTSDYINDCHSWILSDAIGTKTVFWGMGWKVCEQNLVTWHWWRKTADHRPQTTDLRPQT